MLVHRVGLVCIETGVETIQQLPRPMPPYDALNYCLLHHPDHRAWVCIQPILRNGHVMIPYDYYIICLSLSEAGSLIAITSKRDVPSFMKQSLRQKGLLDCNNHLTASGKYVSVEINNCINL